MRLLVGLSALILLDSIGVPVCAQPATEQLSIWLSFHGENATSQAEHVPSLGAEKSDYVVGQLLMFREQQRIAPSLNDIAAKL